MNLAATLDRLWRRFTRGWRRSNCISFATALYLRRIAKGSRGRKKGRPEPPEMYVCFRVSWTRLGILHMLVGKMDRTTGQIKVVSYKPDARKKRGIELIFRGHVERGDKEHSEELKG